MTVNLFMQIGFALCIASSILFHIRLYQMNAHLRRHHPSIWRTFAFGNPHLTRAGKYYSITRLATSYRVNEPELDRQFMVIRRINQSGTIGALVILAGALYQVLA